MISLFSSLSSEPRDRLLRLLPRLSSLAHSARFRGSNSELESVRLWTRILGTGAEGSDILRWAGVVEPSSSLIRLSPGCGVPVNRGDGEPVERRLAGAGLGSGIMSPPPEECVLP